MCQAKRSFWATIHSQCQRCIGKFTERSPAKEDTCNPIGNVSTRAQSRATGMNASEIRMFLNSDSVGSAALQQPDKLIMLILLY